MPVHAWITPWRSGLLGRLVPSATRSPFGKNLYEEKEPRGTQRKLIDDMRGDKV
jgi:hypothetical protein